MKRLISILMVIASWQLALSQQHEGNFDAARKLAYERHYNEALIILEQLVLNEPESYDLLVFQSLVYGWKGDIENAIIKINHVISNWPASLEAKEVRARFYFWKKDYTSTIAQIDSLGMLSPEMITIKVNSLINISKDEAALNTLDQYQQIVDQDPKLEALQQELRKRLARNKVLINLGAGRNVDLQQNWIWTEVGYSRRFGKITLVPAISIAHLYEEAGMELRLDSYATVTPGTYLHAIVEYSWSNIFPELTLGLEAFQSLPARFEFSAGTRGYKFDSLWQVVYTLGISKFMGKNFILYRVYLQDQKQENPFTHNVIFRRMMRSNFLEISLATGSQPLVIEGVNEFTEMRSDVMGLGGQFGLGNSGALKAMVFWEHFRISEERQNNRISLSLSYQLPF